MCELDVSCQRIGDHWHAARNGGSRHGSGQGCGEDGASLTRLVVLLRLVEIHGVSHRITRRKQEQAEIV